MGMPDTMVTGRRYPELLFGLPDMVYWKSVTGNHILKPVYGRTTGTVIRNDNLVEVSRTKVD